MASLSRSLLRLGHSLCLKGEISQADNSGRSIAEPSSQLPMQKAQLPLAGQPTSMYCLLQKQIEIESYNKCPHGSGLRLANMSENSLHRDMRRNNMPFRTQPSASGLCVL